MIEFNGYLSGNAEKRFLERTTNLGQLILLISMLLVMPTIVIVAVKMNMLMILVGYFLACILILLLTRIPKNQKERKSITPKRICIDDESLTCHAEKYVESKFVVDVKEVLDYGDFYEIRFPFGKVSEKFICQKDLLTKGSLAEFEELFEGKIRRTSSTGDG